MPSDHALDEAGLRRIAGRWRDHQSQYFDEIELFPPEKPDSVVGRFHSGHYPTEVSQARVELTIRTNGDVNLTYAEEWPGTRWHCRWDVHENPHNHAEHFHPPPTPGAADAVDVAYPEIPEGIVTVAFSFVEDRVGDLWDGDLTYPSEYRFEWEYGPDVRR